jgi:hypothetical protein
MEWNKIGQFNVYFGDFIELICECICVHLLSLGLNHELSTLSSPGECLYKQPIEESKKPLQ